MFNRSSALGQRCRRKTDSDRAGNDDTDAVLLRPEPIEPPLCHGSKWNRTIRIELLNLAHFFVCSRKKIRNTWYWTIMVSTTLSNYNWSTESQMHTVHTQTVFQSNRCWMHWNASEKLELACRENRLVLKRTNCIRGTIIIIIIIENGKRRFLFSLF